MEVVKHSMSNKFWLEIENPYTHIMKVILLMPFLYASFIVYSLLPCTTYIYWHFSHMQNVYEHYYIKYIIKIYRTYKNLI